MKIGIGISGGGYRATGYSLGTLSYLHAIKLDGNKNILLEKVDAISTVSGGSITGLSYVLSIKRNVQFNDYFKSTFSFIIEKDLVNDSLFTLVKNPTINSLIRGFENTYNTR